MMARGGEGAGVGCKTLSKCHALQVISLSFLPVVFQARLVRNALAEPCSVINMCWHNV